MHEYSRAVRRWRSSRSFSRAVRSLHVGRWRVVHHLVQSPAMIFAFEDFEFDADRLELRRAGTVVDADTLVLRLLALLVRNAGRLVSKDELVREVWDGRAVADNVITVCMARLRKALGDKRGEKEMVTTVYGRGYRFVREISERSELQRPVSTRAAQLTPGSQAFVGRERVLEDLERSWREAELGRGRLCALLGEPGIGKTHAVEVFVRGLPTSTRVVWGFCREAGDTPPLFPWLRMLREIVSEGDPELARIAAEPALQLALRGASTDSPSALSEAIWHEGQQRHATFDAVSRLFAQLARRAPLLLVLEDLHRADAASLELLAHLVGELALRRILVIATVRQTESPSREIVRSRLAQVLGHRNCERIALARLRESDVHAYVTGVLGGADEKLARRVFEKSEGNPFFMAELCRQLRDRDPRDRDVLALPQAALDLIRRHVARLDEEARGVLSAAAVSGRSFELWLLRAITGRDVQALMASLDAALAAEVLIAAPDSATAFAFGHELLRAVLYDALPAAERRAWHVRVAEALEQRAAEGESIPPSELAYHLHAGLPASDPRKTVHYCRLAAAASAGSFANEDVVRYVKHAVEALELTDKPSMRLRMHLVYMQAMYARGDSAASYEQAARELARLARTCGDGPMLVRAAIMYNLHPGFRQLSGAADALDAALELLPADDIAMRSAALGALAMDTPNCWRREPSDRLLAEAEQLARASNSRASRYVALIGKLQLRGGPEHAAEANAVLEELDLLAQQNPTRMPVLPVDLALYRAVHALQGGDLERALASAETAAAHSRRLHHEELLWHAERMRALIALNAGRGEAALNELARLHERASRPELFGVQAFAAFDRAIWFGELGARAPLDDAERSALAYDAADPPSLWSMKLRALAAAGLREESRTALRALAPRDLAALPSDRDLLGTLGHVVVAALLVGAPEYASAAAERLARHREGYAAHIAFQCEGSVPHLLGLVALAQGDTDRAIAELEVGIVRNERAGLGPSAGYARLELARACLCRRGASDRARAQELLLESQRQAELHGMRRLARAAATLRDAPPR